MRHLKIRLALPLLAVGAFAALAHTQATSGAATSKEQIKGLNTAFLDRTADPCTDFYQYACGNFSKLYPIPADRSGYGNFYILADENEKALHSILEKGAANNPSRTPNEQKIGDYYASCLDTDAINKAGLKGLQPEFDRIDALKSKGELPPLLAHDQLIGVNAFVSFGELQDFKDARKQIAVLDQGGLGLPERDYYLRTGTDDEKLRQQYVEHIAKTLKLLGEPDDKVAADAKAIMELETGLAKNSLDITSQRDPKNIYHLMPLANAEQLAPAIDWNAFLKDTGAPPITEINVTYPPFFKGLNALLESTSLDTVKVYLKWQLVNSTPTTALPEDLDKEQFDFNGKVLSGRQEERARWKRCVTATDGALGEALGQVYAAKEFPPSSKAAAQQMVRDIEAAMEADIDTLDWMSAETRVKAKEKLHAIANKIGYPDKWRDYSSLKIVRGDALGNAVRAQEFEAHRQLNKIGKPVDRGEFGMSPPTVNAYYNPSMNDINFPAGILQPPFYGAKESDAVNYGHIGAVVGHELTHGFDDQGRKFDGSGNLTEREADAGREHRRQRGHPAGFHGTPCRRQAEEHQPGTEDRWLHARTAILSGLRAELVRGHEAGERKDAGADRSALTGSFPRERRGAQHQGFWRRVQLQGQSADGASQRLPCLVRRAGKVCGIQVSKSRSFDWLRTGSGAPRFEGTKLAEDHRLGPHFYFSVFSAAAGVAALFDSVLVKKSAMM